MSCRLSEDGVVTCPPGSDTPGPIIPPPENPAVASPTTAIVDALNARTSRSYSKPFPCPNPSNPCIDPSIPVLNWSSETPDLDLFYGRNPDGWTPPPLGQDWTASGCVGRCTSTVSQEDADLCAARQAVLCNHDEWPGTEVFYNRVQTCLVHCPDGQPFTFTVAAGQFAALFNQASADTAAYSYACRQAAINATCLGTLTGAACVGSAYSSRVSIRARYYPVTVSVESGALPTGLSLSYNNTSFTVSGTPTVPGESSFTIRVADNHGNFMLKAYTICVVSISPDTLNDATNGTAYFAQLYTPACASGTLSWQVVDGILPNGLTLDEETGRITGTPNDEDAEYSFRVRVQTDAT